MNVDDFDMTEEELEPRPRSRSSRDDSGKSDALRQVLESDPRIAMWLADPLAPETGKALLRLQSLPDLARMAVMPDVHPSADVCVGCVLGTSELIFPQAIGGDIGCGMTTVRLKGVAASSLTPRDTAAILTQLGKRVDVMRRPSSRDPQGTEMPDPATLHATHLSRLAQREGASQLGTLGRGNHFVEVQRDDEDTLWIMVHSGSRAMGQAIAGHYVRIAQREGVRAALAGLKRGTPAGEDYLADQSWGVAYAKANRLNLLDSAAKAVREISGGRADWSTLIDLPHNLARIERFEDAGELVVHRKGAAPASLNQPGLIPGSAGTISVHVEGRGDQRSMCSSSHGAGRLLSRSAARQSITSGDVRRQMGQVAFDRQREHSLRDEAPGAYRDLRIVMQAQHDLVKATRTLRPLVSFKASG